MWECAKYNLHMFLPQRGIAVRGWAQGGPKGPMCVWVWVWVWVGLGLGLGLGRSGSGSGWVWLWVWVGGGGSRLSANLPAPGSRRPAPGARRRTPCLCANPREDREAAVEATEAAVETTEASLETTEGGIPPPLKAKKSASAAGDAWAFDFAPIHL